MSEISIKRWLINYAEGAYESRNRLVQIEAGWYDWFCQDSSLARKTKTLGKKLASLAGCPKFDIDTTYVWFNNNCPFTGPLYDDFRIADLDTGNTRYCVSYLNKGCHGCQKAHWEVYGRENDFKEPIVEGSWDVVKKWFWEL